jgi:hypothetical protein
VRGKNKSILRRVREEISDSNSVLVQLYSVKFDSYSGEYDVYSAMSTDTDAIETYEHLCSVCLAVDHNENSG